MKRFWESPFLKISLVTLMGILMGYLLGNISLFTGIGFALGLGYFYIARSNG